MTPLIIGDRADSHVVAVLEAMRALGSGPVPMLVDGPSLQATGFSLTLDCFRHDGSTIQIHEPEGTGWLRRYAPTLWGRGQVVGELEAVTKRAFVALVGAITRMGSRNWLTPLDEMLAAEDRLVQLEAARALGLRIPHTIVTSDPDEAIGLLGASFVVKPLAGGYFWRDGKPRAVFTSEINETQAHCADFGAAPFVAQEALRVRTHYRVVTVGDEAWVACLDAEGRPLDWRQQTEAHFSWVPASNNLVCESALVLAKHLGIGYSSQDWVEDSGGIIFLDLNPGGQWLFLPEPIASDVTRSIARFLVGDSQ